MPDSQEAARRFNGGTAMDDVKYVAFLAGAEWKGGQVAERAEEALTEIHAVMLAYDLDMFNQVEVYEAGDFPTWYKQLARASKALAPLTGGNE